jgi:hypothetical protein
MLEKCHRAIAHGAFECPLCDPRLRKPGVQRTVHEVFGLMSTKLRCKG